jgi:hypothetical protein
MTAPTIQFDARGVPYTQSGFLDPLSAASQAGFFIPEGPEKAALLAERGMSPETVAALTAYAQRMGVTAQNPFGNRPAQMNGFLKKYEWDPTTGTYKGHLGEGIKGLAEGGAALAGPLVIGPAIAGAAGAGGASAASGAGSGGTATSAGTGAAIDTAPAWGAGGYANAATFGGTAAGGSVPLGGITAGATDGMVNGLTPGQIAGLHLGGSAAGTSLTHDIVSHLLTPGGIATLASAIPSLIRDAGGGANNDPTTQALLDMALKRQQRVDPLHASVTRLSNAMLPTAYQNGGQ